jgi:hypothetical protein
VSFCSDYLLEENNRMTQTATVSPWKFIPRPIEEQIHLRQPGVLLDYFQFGWVRKARGDRQTMPGPIKRLLFLIVGLIGWAGTLGVGILIANIIENTHLISNMLGLIAVPPVLLGFIFTIGAFLPTPTTFCLAIYSDGLAYAKGTDVTILAWSEIASLEWKRTTNWLKQSFDHYTLSLQNGQTLRWMTNARVLKKINAIIQEKISEPSQAT